MPGVRNADRVIIGALVLSLPSFEQAFTGGISVAAVFVRFVLALLVCWGFGALIERLVDSYSRQARQTDLARRMQQLAAARNGANNDQGQGR
jgi:hypothetical protein